MKPSLYVFACLVLSSYALPTDDELDDAFDAIQGAIDVNPELAAKFIRLGERYILGIKPFRLPIISCYSSLKSFTTA